MHGVNLPYTLFVLMQMTKFVVLQSEEILHNLFLKKIIYLCRSFCMLENGTGLQWFSFIQALFKISKIIFFPLYEILNVDFIFSSFFNLWKMLWETRQNRIGAYE